MKAIRTKAPGKVFIAGEYSVLFGGSALVAVIDRFAEAEFIPKAHYEFWVHYHDHWQREDQHPLWLSMLEAAKDLGFHVPFGIYKIDSRDFFSKNGLKLGVGSSAAACVALSKIICAANNFNEVPITLSLALKTHDNFSAQRGSGADITASAFGTSIEFKKSAAENSQGIIDLSWLWPHLIIIGTNSAQDTKAYVTKAEYYIRKEIQKAALFLAQSDNIVASLLAKPSLENTIVLFNELYKLLQGFGQSCGIDIVSKEHEALYHLAKNVGGSAKPSGAGGGDVGLALVPIKARLEFMKICQKHNFEILKLALTSH